MMNDMEYSPEHIEHPPRNLLTHFDETVEALASIEGPRWLADQFENDRERYPKNIAAAMEKLSGTKKMYAEFIVEGAGGINRWLVRPDGSVVYLQSTKAGGPEKAERARVLGFSIKQNEA